jgi:hypothetical protein
MARRSPKIEVYDGNRLVPKEEQPAFLAGLNARLNARRTEHRLHARADRVKGPPERATVARAMLAVEKAIVEAYSILGRSTTNPSPRQKRQHGVGYMLEREDKWGSAVSDGGFLSEEPPAPPPTAAEIDWSDRPLDWLQMLDHEHRTIVSAGARSKAGDVTRRVNWFRVRAQLPDLSEWSSDRLSRMYREGLRLLAVEVGHA